MDSDRHTPTWYYVWADGWEGAQRRRGRSPNSLRTWSTYVRDLGAYLEEQGIVSAELLTRDVLTSWQDGLRARGLKPASQQVAVSTIRGMLKWADRQELTPRSGLWGWLETPHVPERLLRALEPDQLARILGHYGSVRDLGGLRDRALFWFLATTGARIGEALQTDVAMVTGRMIVRKKGGGEHALVMSGRARAWVLDYLAARGRDQEPALWVHFGPRGRHRLRPDQVNDIWAALSASLDVAPFTNHALRHTMVTELADRDDVSDDDIRQQVGWATATMMTRYRKLRDARRQLIADRLDDLVPETPAPAAAPRRRRRRFRVVQRPV